MHLLLFSCCVKAEQRFYLYMIRLSLVRFYVLKYFVF